MLKDYLQHNYGTCNAKRCLCRTTVWLGKACPNWKPVKAESYEELKEEQKSLGG